MNVSTQRHGAALLWIFIASGFAGLIYQSIWTSYLGLFLGHSAYAQSLVLMLFMGGMAAGAWLVSRRSEHLKRPLFWYAVIELLIGLLGLTFNPLYGWSTTFAYDVLFPGAGGMGTINAIRWAISILLVLPQCILLGATFPLMSAGFLRLRPDADGKVIAGLYFTNSIGAAAGALAATYLLVPRVGLPGTVLTAGLLNVLVAFAVYPLSKQEREAAIQSPEPSTHGGNATPMLILIAAAITGLTSFVYEITWVRMLSLALGTTIHAFELMLAAFISGIAFGGLWLSRNAHRIHSPLKTVGWVQIWMGVAALASMFVYANAFEWVGWLMRVITRTSEGYTLYNLSSGIIALLVMFPAAFFAGMTLPLLTVILLRNGAGERAIGRVYAANTLGAIVGVVLTVHILLPLVGLKMALWLAAAGDLVLGIVLLRRVGTGRFLAPAPVMAGVAAVIALTASMLLVRFDPLVLASSVYRTGATTLGSKAKMLFNRDGKTASVAVYETNYTSRIFAIATNGKVDAGMTPSLEGKPRSDEATMALLAALPLSLKEKLDEVGVIGFGSGMTTHMLLGSKRVANVDTVEIEPMMVQGARMFGPRVSRAFDDPRSHIIIDDAKSYFSSSRKQYDVIVSEPSNPWMGGTASLFSSEFYRFVPRHLKQDGLFVQWLQLYEIDQTLVSSVLAAMLPEFNDVQAYLANSGDLILIASPNGRVPQLQNFTSKDVALQRELARVGFGNLRDMQDAYVLDRRGLAAFVRMFPSTPNSDFFPVLQLQAPESRFTRGTVTDLGTVLTAPWPISPTLGRLPRRALSTGLPEHTRDIPNDRKLRAARELRGALVDDEPIAGEFASQGDAVQLEALRGMARDCKLDRAPAQASQIMFSLALETIPFLDADANHDIWVEPKWLGACKPTHPLIVDTLALLAAAAKDDHVTVIDVGQDLLNGPNAGFVFGNTTAAYYVWGAMQYSAFRLGSPQLAEALQARYGARLPSQVTALVPIRMLAQLASGQAAGAPVEQATGGR